MPSCQLILEEPVSVGIHINPDNKIYLKVPILLLLPTPTIDILEYISLPPAPTLLLDITPSPRRSHSQTIEISKCTIVFLKTEYITSQSSFQLEFIISVLAFLTKAVSDSHDTMLDTKWSTCTTPLFSLVTKVILSNLALLNP